MSDYNIDLAKVKHYMRVLHDRDDALIQSLIKAGLQDVQNWIDRKFTEVDSDGEYVLIDEDGNLPAPLEAAVQMVVDDLYRNRATQSESNLFKNITFERLIAPYRRMGV